MNRNPFNFSKPAGGEDFYNRTEEIEMAIGFLGNLNSFSIIGERRIGKTSFLQYILSRNIMEKYDIDLRKHIVIYLNLGSLHRISKESIIKKIVENLEIQTRIKIKSNDVFDKFEAYVEELISMDKHLIIAFDEFEVTSSILDVSFSHWLRYIFQNQKVMAITASQTTVGGIEPDSMVSPLFNIFGNINLGLFSREETENLLKSLFHKGGQEIEDDEISFLIDLSGGNPYLVQFFGYYYYEKRKNSKEMDYSEFQREMLYRVRDQFEGYWRHLSKEEKEFLQNDEESRDDRIEYELKTKGFIIKVDNQWKIFSPLFQEFITGMTPKISQPSLIEKSDKNGGLLPKKGTRHLTHEMMNILVGVLSALIANSIWEYVTSESEISLIDIILFFENVQSIFIFAFVFLIVFISLKKLRKKRNRYT